MGSLYKNTQLMMEFPKSPNYLPGDVICNIATYAYDATFYLKCDQVSDLWQQLEWAFDLNMIYETLKTGAGIDSLTSMLEKLSWFRLTSLITLVLLM